MAYLDQEKQIASATQSQASYLKDIAESLRILSGRTSLKENRLRERINSLQFDLEYASEKEYPKISEEINKLEDEIYQDRLKREEKYDG